MCSDPLLRQYQSPRMQRSTKTGALALAGFGLALAQVIGSEPLTKAIANHCLSDEVIVSVLSYTTS